MIKYDVFTRSLNRYGEINCGDISKIISMQEGREVSFFIVDGLGSGFTANLHAGITSKLIVSLIKQNINITEIASIVLSSMEKHADRGIDYCAFTLVNADRNGKLNILVMNMPEPLLLRHGKHVSLNYEEYEISNRRIKFLQYQLKQFDTLVTYSDGVIKSGIGGNLNLGLGEKNVLSYITAAYKPRITAEKLVNLLLSVSNSLYMNRPGDDVTAVVLRVIRDTL